MGKCHLRHTMQNLKWDLDSLLVFRFRFRFRFRWDLDLDLDSLSSMFYLF